jgi:hypothetical protein
MNGIGLLFLINEVAMEESGSDAHKTTFFSCPNVSRARRTGAPLPCPLPGDYPSSASLVPSPTTRGDTFFPTIPQPTVQNKLSYHLRRLE